MSSNAKSTCESSATLGGLAGGKWPTKRRFLFKIVNNTLFCKLSILVALYNVDPNADLV